MIKNTLYPILAIAIMSLLLASICLASGYNFGKRSAVLNQPLRGDINRDGAVNALDITCLEKLIIGLEK